jgi:flavodoxin
MRKLFKIIFGIFVVVMALFIACAAIITYDIAGVLATDTHPLPNGSPIGQALVVYDPGLSGGAKDVATRIGYNLQDAGYNVVLAGVKSTTAADISGYDVVVVGGPIYAGKPAKTIQEYLNTLNTSADQKVGVFGYGSVSIDDSNSRAVIQDVAGSNSLTLDAVVKIVSDQDFVSRLVE